MPLRTVARARETGSSLPRQIEGSSESVTGSATQVAACFTYRDLNVEIKEIRLLEVEPAVASSSQEPDALSDCGFEYNLRHVSLMTTPLLVYETVSYCWGDPEATETVRIGGYVLTIPHNTSEVLRQLSLPDQRRTLWIDAICIDQSNQKERSQQVTQMRQIFSYGAANLIHLGGESPLTELAVNNLLDIRKEIAERLQSESKALTDLLKGPLDIDHEPLKTDFDLEGLVDLYSCPWFTRLWVLQEALLPAKNIVIRGSVQFELDSLLEVPGALVTRHWPTLPEELRDSVGFTSALLMWKVQRAFQDNAARNGVTLFDALSVAELLNCSDRHDKVFAVLGITIIDSSPRIAQAAAKLLRPNYSKPLADVYRDATRFCVIQSGRLDVLSKPVPRYPLDPLRINRVSWAFTLDRGSDVTLYPNHLMIKADVTRQHIEISERNALDQYVDLRELQVIGFDIGTVAECTATLETNFTNGSVVWSTLHNFLNSSFDLSQRSGNTTIELTRALTENQGLFELGQSLESSVRLLTALREHLAAAVSRSYVNLDNTAEPEDPSAELSQLRRFIGAKCRYRRLFSTTSGILGIASVETQSGDTVAFLRGARNPCTLRAMGSGKYMFLGECHINNIDDDSDIEMVRVENSASWEWSILI